MRPNGRLYLFSAIRLGPGNGTRAQVRAGRRAGASRATRGRVGLTRRTKACGPKRWGTRAHERGVTRRKARRAGLPGGARQVGQVAASGASAGNGQTGQESERLASPARWTECASRPELLPGAIPRRSRTWWLSALTSQNYKGCGARRVLSRARPELHRESERAWPGSAKVNGETERESVRVHLSAGALSRGRRGRAPVGGELPRARECAGPGPTWTNSFGLHAAAETAAPSTCHGPSSPVGHLRESESRSAQAARALRSTKGQLRQSLNGSRLALTSARRRRATGSKW